MWFPARLTLPWRRGRVVYGTALLTRSAFERHHPFESDRLRELFSR